MSDEPNTELDVCVHYAGAIKHKRAIEADLMEIRAELDRLEPAVLTAFERAGVQSMNVRGVTLYVSTTLRANDAGDRGALVAALKADDATAWMVKEGVNLNMLSGWLRELERDADGKPTVPAAVAAHLRIEETPEVRARMN